MHRFTWNKKGLSSHRRVNVKDYFRTSDYFSGPKKINHQLMSKTSRFTGKLGSRIGDQASGIEDRFKKT